ncbi:type II CAAX endopeptidase family protein [Paludicola sp. MB14-C6]|uniref:CPBP family intramembrane glutamic endopeptidase n=1 Tax=Paludihabitans sp. MB14-C6 TaxID=3070656 RepID=UPI0027DAF5C8|nr:type II CAAX endopeptidase family protein [Paludicola sp. MB14-C6]WMJ22386.1 type II CAAX endopeptidase family protein [Paludicola sp. MB14-C6]
MAKSIRNYLVATFLFSWILWDTLAVGSYFKISFLTYGTPLAMVLFVLGGISPAICEIILQKKNNTEQEFKSFMKNIMTLKHSPTLYIYAIGGALFIFAIPFLFGQITMKQPLYIGFLMIFPMIIGGGIEEIGWRGLLQPQLEKKLSHFLSTIIVAAIWAVWHIPLWFIPGTNQSNLSFIWFVINAFTLSFFIGSVCFISKSIFLSILAHASVNGFWEVFPPSQDITLSVIILIVVAVTTVLLDYTVAKHKTKFI